MIPQRPHCPECGLHSPCSTCGKPRPVAVVESAGVEGLPARGPNYKWASEPSDAVKRVLTERVRERIAALVYDAGRPDLCAKVRALDLDIDALLEEGT